MPHPKHFHVPKVNLISTLDAALHNGTMQVAPKLIEAGAFPSDRYAVESQLRFHGFDPALSLIELDADQPGGTDRDNNCGSASYRFKKPVTRLLLSLCSVPSCARSIRVPTCSVDTEAASSMPNFACSGRSLHGHEIELNLQGGVMRGSVPRSQTAFS